MIVAYVQECGCDYNTNNWPHRSNRKIYGDKKSLIAHKTQKFRSDFGDKSFNGKVGMNSIPDAGVKYNINDLNDALHSDRYFKRRPNGY